MSVWDFVAAASIGTNINKPDSKSGKVLKKINSATLSVLNGDSVSYVSGGGRTSNTFGANTNFTCDMEALLEGYFAGKIHADPLSKTSMFFGGLLLGPGAENKLLMGNATVLTYMPHHSSNFTVYRGGAPESHSYATWDQTCFCIKLSATLFALVVFGYELLYSFAGSFKKQLMSPVGDSKYISTQEAKIHAKEKEKASLEAAEKKQEEEQNQREASGDVPSQEQQEAQEKESALVKKNIHDSENEINDMESSLKTAERQKEWLLYANIILENRGMYLLKILEQLNASLMKAQVAVTNAQKKVDGLEAKLKTTEAALTTQTDAASALVATGSYQQVALDAIQKEIESLNTTKAETVTQLQTAQDELKTAKDGLEKIQKKP